MASSSLSAVALGGAKRSGKGKAVEEKPAKRMRTDSGRATYAQPVPSKSKGKVQVRTPSSRVKKVDSVTENGIYFFCTGIVRHTLK